MTKKSSSKSAAKKTVASSAPAKKATKKAAAKKTAPKKAAAKKVVAETPVKEVAKKAAKKAAAKKGGTSVVAKVDLGWGNTLYVRGEGAGLSWDKGVAMENNGSDEWTLSLSSKAQFKVLRNDCDWSSGDNFVAVSGKQTVITPVF